MPALLPATADLRASLRRRPRRDRRPDHDAAPAGTPVALNRRLYVTAATDEAISGRAVAVAVDRRGTRYLGGGPDGARRWVAETAVARFSPFGPGDTVIGYVTIGTGAGPRATHAPATAIRRAARRSGWRLAGVACDRGGGPVSEQPALRRALERIAAGKAAGLVVVDLDGVAGSDRAAAELMGAVRLAGGSVVALGADGLGSPDGGPAAAQERIAALRAAGRGPRAIAEELNAEGLRPPGRDPVWTPWTVRAVGGAWPPRGPRRRPAERADARPAGRRGARRRRRRN
jgi:hypothetical protein